MLGTTGAGKSTLIQYLFGALMKQIDGSHIQAAEPIDPRLKEFVSSVSMSSVTRYLNPLKITYLNKERDEEEITVVDTPGFGDT